MLDMYTYANMNVITMQFRVCKRISLMQRILWRFTAEQGDVPRGLQPTQAGGMGKAAT